MEIVLYYAPFTCALAPWLALTEAGAGFETRAIDLRQKQQMTPESLALNPKHKVPLLLVDGKPLTENAAIHSWIADAFPEAGLLPADPWDRLQAISLISWCASGIHAYISRVNSPPKVCDTPGSEEGVIRAATAVIFETFAIADERLAGRDYFFDHFTASDTYFYWSIRRATQLDVDVTGFANCMAFFERMESRPSVQKLLAFEKQTLDSFAAAAA